MRDHELNTLRYSAPLPSRVKGIFDLGFVLYQATQLEQEHMGGELEKPTILYLMSFSLRSLGRV